MLPRLLRRRQAPFRSCSMNLLQDYSRRQGRVSTASRLAMEWGRSNNVLIDDTRRLLYQVVTQGPLACLEIGFGNGDNLFKQSSVVDGYHLGVDLYLAGIGVAIKKIRAISQSNLLIACCEASRVMACLPPRSTNRVNIHFPDPWPKNRHRKRRLVNVHTIRRFLHLCRPPALIHFASDDMDYFDQSYKIAENVVAESCCTSLSHSLPSGFVPRYSSKFSRLAVAQGRDIKDWYIMVNDDYE